jgi:hypothetical protein
MSEVRFICIECGHRASMRPRPDVMYQLTRELLVPYPDDIPIASCEGCGETYTNQAEDEAIRAALLAKHGVPA